MTLTRRSILAAGFAAVPLVAAPARAQGYPARPVRIVLPYGAGGPGDVATRAIADAMGKLWGQPFIVDNRPGANEMIAADVVAKSPGDGYTFLIVSEAAFSLNPFLYSKVPYDPERDFVPVSRIITSPFVLVTRPAFPAGTLKEFVEEVRRQPGKYNYGSIGIGGPNHLAMSWFNNLNGLKMEHVPSRTIVAAIQEVLAGRLDALFAPIGGVAAFIASGQIKPLAVAGKARQPQLAAVPTFAESGFPDFEAGFYQGVFAPRGTPPEIVNRLARDLRRVIHDPDFRAKHFQPLAFEPVGDTPEEFAAFVRNDRELGARRVKISGAKLD